jgi:hypothetical protein
VIVGGLVFAAQRTANRLKDLEDNGKTTQGYITGKNVEQDHHWQDYYVTYRFAAGQSTYNNKDDISILDYYQIQPNTYETVMYMPSNPSDSHLGSVTDATIDRSYLSSLGLGALVLVFVFWIGIARKSLLNKEVRLLRYGVPVQALVTGHSPNGRRGTSLSCTYDVQGKSYSPAYNIQVRYSSAQVGSAITVLCNPRNPSDSYPYKAIVDARIV